MPNRCCVPSCKGNSTKGPRVSTFRFPRDQALLNKWLQIINKKNFYPTKSSRVCELHFEEDAILRETSVVDPSSGRLLSARLEVPRLKKDAIPTKMPVRSSCLSIRKTCRTRQSQQNDVMPTKSDGPPYVSYCKIDRTSPSEMGDMLPMKVPSKPSNLPISETLKNGSSQKKGKMPAKVFDKHLSFRKTCPPEKKDAVQKKVPSILPQLSSSKTHKVHSLANKKVTVSKGVISVAITKSLKLKQTGNENDCYFSLNEGLERIQTSLSSKWLVFKNDTNVIIAMLVCNPAPTITCSAILSHDLMLTAFCSSREMREIGSYKLPMLCNSVKVICDILNSLEKQSYETAVNKISDDLNTYFLVVPRY